MEKLSKRFEVRVFDNKDSHGEFVDAFDTLAEAQAFVQELEEKAKQVVNSDGYENVKDHYCFLFWKIINLAGK